VKTTNNELRTYLDHVDQLLDAPAPDRRRLLEEIEGHLCDAIDHRVANGMDSTAATRAAIEEFGPPSEVAVGLCDTPEETATGWTHWLPIALPFLLTAIAVIGAAYYATKLPDSSMTSARATLRTYLQSTVVFGGITTAGWFWLRHHRRPRTVSPAWLATVAALAVLVI
jgi:hypothetical protein